MRLGGDDSYLTGRVTSHHGSGGDASHDDGADGNDAVVSYRNTRMDDDIAADPNIVANGNRANVLNVCRLACHAVRRIHGVAGDVEDLRTSRYATVLTNGDAVAHDKGAFVTDTGVVANHQSWILRVAGCEKEIGASIDGDVIPYDQIAATLDPVQEYARVKIAAIALAVGFEERFADKDPH